MSGNNGMLPQVGKKQDLKYFPPGSLCGPQ